jgi:predicted GNAT family acetyltransferase
MRQLTEADRDAILGYVGLEPEFNIFTIGDIENFGIATPEVDLYAREADGRWDCLVLRYLNDYVVYSQNAGYDALPVAEFLRTRDVNVISGKKEVVDKLEPYFPERKLRAMRMCKCSGVKEASEAPEGIGLRRLGPSDAGAMAEMMLQLDEYKKLYHDAETASGKIGTNLSGGGTGIGAFRDGVLVSCAQTSATNSISAMVVAVATLPGAQGRGYASAVVTALCREAFAAGKRFLCLFYDNPQAGRIYKRIGFEHCGEYALFAKG